jgi:hypothetical protein
MAEKRFELVGIAKQSIIYHGIIYLAQERVELLVNETEKDFYSQFILIEEVRELEESSIEPKIDSIIQEQIKPTPKPKSIKSTTLNKKVQTSNKK